MTEASLQSVHGCNNTEQNVTEIQTVRIKTTAELRLWAERPHQIDPEIHSDLPLCPPLNLVGSKRPATLLP
jgi:hypothetical protein